MTSYLTFLSCYHCYNYCCRNAQFIVFVFVLHFTFSHVKHTWHIWILIMLPSNKQLVARSLLRWCKRGIREATHAARRTPLPKTHPTAARRCALYDSVDHWVYFLDSNGVPWFKCGAYPSIQFLLRRGTVPHFDMSRHDTKQITTMFYLEIRRNNKTFLTNMHTCMHA